MRVYHFVNKQFGLEDIANRHLKIARVNELNDPFEWQALTSADPQKRDGIRRLKERQDTNTGLLCFSRDWRNPVQWSHYADNHRGLCLGFDVADHLLGEVRYRQRRIDVDWVLSASTDAEGNDRMRQALVTKFTHWKYEKEMRVFVRLDPNVQINGLYFADFSNDLALSEVVVGARCDIGRSELASALGVAATTVKCRKARLAFKTFDVVEQRKASLWP